MPLCDEYCNICLIETCRDNPGSIIENNETTDGNKSRPVSGKSTTSTATSSGNIQNEQPGYRVWYSVEIQSAPAPPEKIIDITCCAQSAALMEVDVYNPLVQTMTFDVIIEGDGLRGDPEIELESGRKKFYQLVFAPSSVGVTQGR